MPFASVHDDSEYSYEVLLNVECQTTMMMEPGISTLSFFSGSKPQLRQRVFDICRANPWLVGTLIKDKTRHEKNAVLRTPRTVTESHIDTVFFDQEVLSLSQEMPFAELSKVVSKNSMVPDGNTCRKKSLPLSKFTLSATQENEFVLIVSISHIVSDGFTYYKILSMLSKDQSIEALDFKRKREMEEKGRKAAGESEYDFLMSGKIVLNVLGKMITNPKYYISAFYLDPVKIKSRKEEEDQYIKGNGNLSDLPFSCSTNDILASTFGQVTKSRIMMMAINWRGRLEGCLDKDAGNYESALVYDPPSYSRPSAIRKSLNDGIPIKRFNPQPLPRGFEAITCQLSMITSWVFPSFNGDLVLDQGNKVLLHLPIFRTTMLPFPIAIVFTAKKDTLGVIYAGPHKIMSEEKLRAAGAPIGSFVNSKIFG